MPELCPHLHLPVQSGSTRVLEAMNRRYDRETYLDIIARLRDARPGIAVTTDLIVGYPTETEADFEDTLRLMERGPVHGQLLVQVLRAPGHTGPAAPASGSSMTPGYRPASSASRTCSARSRSTPTRARIGSQVEVLVDGASRHGDGQLTGRCPDHRIVNFRASAPVAPGCYLPVDVTGCTPHSLLGVAAGIAA